MFNPRLAMDSLGVFSCQFDELIDLLGLSNRMRKSAILQEAILAIKVPLQRIRIWYYQRCSMANLLLHRP